jgi:3-methylcrotonyl-CoA carboxylase beta subunit
MLVLETAKPEKFAETIHEAIGVELGYAPELQEMLDAPQHVTEMGDDEHALRIVRGIVSTFGPRSDVPWTTEPVEAPALDPAELYGIIPADWKTGFDMREVIARLADGSRFHEYQPAYGTTLVCGFANLWGYKIGILANNGVLFNDSALKGAHFIELCNQNNTPLVFLQNITGYMVGREYEARGITKDGAKMIMAQSCSRVPKFTVMCHGSFGAGNYGMCGRAFDARFLFSWPNHQIGVMGGEQAARTLAEVKMRQLEREGRALDKAVIDGVYQDTLKAYQEQLSAYYSTSELWDDGIINPVDTRNALGVAISASLNAPLADNRYGVFRF